ncbi:MAG: hypothetical protein GKR92_02190 [Gammaproteobacteria bacterium]|nr:MAG: hypothetical protein GKR92_02190 [Gammaproteobacteria bacterium]
MKVIISPIFYFVKILLLVSVSTAAADSFSSKLIDSTNNTVIDQCVKNVNQTSDDGLDTADRLYQTGMCHFCVKCNFEMDNGQLFLVNDELWQGKLPYEAYKTAYGLISQAAGLGDRTANYGLAVLLYVSDLTNNRLSKIEISKNKTDSYRNTIKNEELTDEEVQQSIDKITERIYEKNDKQDFSPEIHKHLLVAAKQGYMPAQFALGEVYFRGIGVTPDAVQAYAWAATAVAQNPPFGSFRRDEKATNLDHVKLNEAEAIAEEYMKKYTNIYDSSSISAMR